MKDSTKFEDKLKELEIIVSELESGDADLDLALEKYTKAMKLAKECSVNLKNIEDKVTKILKDNNTLEDFKTE